MTQCVAVAPSESLDGIVLLALDFTKYEDFKFVKLCREGMKQVRKVKTRSQEKDEEVEVKQNRKLRLQEYLFLKTLTGIW